MIANVFVFGEINANLLKIDIERGGIERIESLERVDLGLFQAKEGVFDLARRAAPIPVDIVPIIALIEEQQARKHCIRKTKARPAFVKAF